MALTVKELSFRYSKQATLSNISFTIDSGQFVAFLGENGAGKTTLFKLLLGLLKAEHGSIYWQDLNLQTASPKAIAEQIAYVPQQSNGSFNHTVIDLVEMGHVSDKDPHQTEKALNYLTMLGIESLALRPFQALSGGQQQLVRIAQALMQDTPLILMDEPTANLDYGNQLKVLDQCRQLVQDGYTIIMTSHQPQDVLTFCDQALLLKDGQLLVHDTVERALTPERIEALYGVPVELKQVDEKYPQLVIPKLYQRRP